MKKQGKFLFTLSVLILGGFMLLNSCGGEKLKTQINEQKEQITSLNDSVAKLKNLLDHKKKRVKKPKEIISLGNATELYNSYSINRACVIEAFEIGKGNIRDICKTEREPKKITPARSSFIEYKVLKQYIAYVEQETAKRKIPLTGFRFYFSNYPDKKYFNDKRPIKSPRRNTFFIAPTINKDSKNLGFTIFESNDGNFETRILEEFFETQQNTILGKKLNKAGFLNFSQEPIEISLQINDVGSHP